MVCYVFLLWHLVYWSRFTLRKQNPLLHRMFSVQIQDIESRMNLQEILPNIYIHQKVGYQQHCYMRKLPSPASALLLYYSPWSKIGAFLILLPSPTLNSVLNSNVTWVNMIGRMGIRIQGKMQYNTIQESTLKRLNRCGRNQPIYRLYQVILTLILYPPTPVEVLVSHPHALGPCKSSVECRPTASTLRDFRKTEFQALSLLH
jgi:hypothetical protein